MLKKFASWDSVYMPDEGEVESAQCGICNTVMTVQRHSQRYSRWPRSEPIPGAYCDFFLCPHVEEQWHAQLEYLWRKHSECGVQTFRNAIEAEIEEVLLYRQVTIPGKHFSPSVTLPKKKD